MRDPGRERVGVVVARQAYGDHDLILRLVVPDEGRVVAFLRGGQKRPRGLDVATRARVRLRGREGGMDTLVEAEVEESRLGLRSDYGRLALAQYACELVGAFVHEGQPEPRLFALLETALLVLDAAQGTPGRAFLAAVQLKTLTFAGVCPEVLRAMERLERLRRLPLRELVDEPLDAEAEALVYEAVRAHLGHELGARALVAGLG
ncbi:MAG: DNA repair protein RecO [Deltaproteobacteria bacterium]|nr:DNA repair protein RecO [Deltaproteobacteria bacterium]